MSDGEVEGESDLAELEGAAPVAPAQGDDVQPAAAAPAPSHKEPEEGEGVGSESALSNPHPRPEA